MKGITRTPREQLPWYPEWTKDAECAKYSLEYVEEIFFDYGRNAAKISAAKGICAECSVIKNCYRTNKWVPMGILFGMTWLERWRHPKIYNRKGFPDTSHEYSYFAQFFGKRSNGIGGRTRIPIG